MSQAFEQQTFENLFDRDSGRVFQDMEFRRCMFDMCAVSVTYEPQRRSVVRDVRLFECRARRCTVWSAVLDDVLVDGLRTDGLLQVAGAVCRHVVLRGRMGRLRFTPLIEPLTATPAQQRAFEDANVDFYAGVDWALDISDAEFEEVDLGGIPGHLVRRDPATSALVTREKALEGVWRTLDLSGTWWDIALNDIARSRMPSEVLVAPRRHAKFRRLVEGLNLLRDAGVAEPN